MHQFTAAETQLQDSLRPNTEVKHECSNICNISQRSLKEKEFKFCSIHCMRWKGSVLCILYCLLFKCFSLQMILNSHIRWDTLSQYCQESAPEVSSKLNMPGIPPKGGIQKASSSNAQTGSFWFLLWASVCAFYSISKVEPGLHMKESHFGYLHLWSLIIT